ncbi:LEA type 2 family protein [Amycolatopsis sp. cmx-4-68]|uniref:NDR1/HIN1-like protein n=1 Tax=Amycolatopsis sp. cmx-4-68 TaxID=2790938 RepID=UPI00397D6257
MRKISKRSAVVLGAAGVVLVAGVAYAAWTSTGSGSGAVTSTTSASSTIGSDTTGTPLYPGAAKTFTVTVTNPNAYPVVVNSISAGSSAVTGDCAAGAVTSAAVSNPTGTIAAGGTGVYTLTATMAKDAADACQGKTFTLPLTATLSSNA